MRKQAVGESVTPDTRSVFPRAVRLWEDIALSTRADLILRLRQRLALSLPTAQEILVGSPLWGVMMALSALATLYFRNGAETSRLYSILLLFFCGGVLAWPFALLLGRLGAIGRRRETRFASFFLCLTVCTIASTAFLFAMDYRLFYARWHAPFGTRIWTYQFVFTSLGAVYQFVIMGIRLYLPFGFAALGLTSLWLAMQMPHRKR